MLRGPDKVIECPKCKQPARVFTLLSGNTFNARSWTDGKREMPMLPRPPVVTRCSKCGHFYWTLRAREIGTVPVAAIPLWEPEAEGVPDEWKKAEPVRELSETEYFEAIAAGLASGREEEFLLRLLAWWAGNDPLRSRKRSRHGRRHRAPRRSAAAIANMERLLDLLDESRPDQRLMKAEIFRELGRFDEALQLLNIKFATPSKQAAADTISRLAREHDTLVREIPQPD